ncbi:Serine/threonine-protein kinase cds1 [Colletotrichum fructicola]|nr:Serine/threonine-protein kinase cds1 [Colletotrichum fructicola]
MTEKVDYYRELEAVMKFSQERYTPSFVQSYGWFESSEAMFIAMEYVPHGDLQNYLSSPIPVDEARIITRQLAEGLHHMHMNGFTHRDLKPGNILVVSRGPDWLVQISDFGISRRLRPDQSTLGTMRRGTLGFIAPEMLGFITDRTHPYAVDIWSLGAVVFTMVTKTLFMTDFGLLQNSCHNISNVEKAKRELGRYLAMDVNIILKGIVIEAIVLEAIVLEEVIFRLKKAHFNAQKVKGNYKRDANYGSINWKYRIPPKYDLSRWDPRKTPLLFLYCVFDLISIGTWFNDTIMSCRQYGQSISDKDMGMIKGLAILLETLDDKLSMIIQPSTHLQKADDRETIQDLTDGGERLVIKVQKFLQAWQSMMSHGDEFEAKESWEGYLLESGAMKHLGTEKLRSRVETLEQSLRIWVLRYDAYNSEKVKHAKSKKRAGRI